VDPSRDFASNLRAIIQLSNQPAKPAQRGEKRTP
jgi:hypothetical protein